MGQSPYETVTGFIIGPWLAQAVRAAVDLSLAEHLADGPRTAAEIAEAEGSDPQATARFLRACAAMGLVAYAEEGFVGTEVLAVLHRDAPMSLRDLAASQSSACLWRTWARIPEAVRSGESQTTRALGSFALAMLAKHPGLDAIVLDLPHSLPGAQAAAAERGLDDRFVAVAGDFFEEVPRGDILLLKFILHDWSDDDCIRILSNCRDALRPGGRIVITEIVIDDQAPGIAPLMDIAMLASAGSRERTLAEFDDLLTRTGLRRTAATAVEPPYVVLEATPAA